MSVSLYFLLFRLLAVCKNKSVCVIILKESIRFRAIKKEQFIQKINCSECDSFQLYQFAETLAVIYMGIVSSLKLKRTQKAAKT